MTGEEILESAKLIHAKGLRTIILQSGEDSFYDTDFISYLIYSIKRRFDVAITLNLGQRTFDEYKTWKIAGADSYLLKYESANPKLFSLYHGKAKLEERISQLRYLKRIGYRVGSGNIIGLPHQSIEDIADDIILFKELNIDLAAFGPFIPALNTPYQNCIEGDISLALRVTAIIRLMLNEVQILSGAACDTLDCKGSEKGVSAGANLIMRNYTPAPYRKDYHVFDGEQDIN
jgi:biotin synthase